MYRVSTIVGTRPELIKLSRTIIALEECFEHTLIHTGQNYDKNLSDIFFDELKLPQPSFSLGIAAATSAEAIGRCILEIDRCLEAVRPHAVLILGDTNSCLGAIAAKKRHIPVFHMEAGNRCFDERVPEEVNRRIVDHFSDVNLVYSEHARNNLLSEGFPSDRIFKTGTPMTEVLAAYSSQIRESNILKSLGLHVKGYFVLSLHREENVDEPAKLRTLLETMERLIAEFDVPIFFSVHPRTRKRIDLLGVKTSPRLIYSNPLGFFDYIRLQQDALCVLSDSGTVTEEAAILDFVAITVRETHERPEGMDCGTLIMSGLSTEGILNAVRTAVKLAGRGKRSVPDYENAAVSTQVVKLIASYIPYVHRKVWQSGFNGLQQEGAVESPANSR
jgi:UDP-N-acetylglucosamine 2-epimerase